MIHTLKGVLEAIAVLKDSVRRAQALAWDQPRRGWSPVMQMGLRNSLWRPYLATVFALLFPT